jgi:predicted nucleic acid-binding protein
VWDASALHASAAADRIDVLFDLASEVPQAPAQHMTTAAVAEELRRNGLWEACAPHLEIVHVDALDELQSLARWLGVVSNGEHSRGEATVLAWAEVHAGIPIIDDHGARRTAIRHGLPVHGTLWVIAEAVNAGKTSRSSASSLVNTLLGTGARYPFQTDGFEGWAIQQGLMTPSLPEIREFAQRVGAD